MGWDAYSSAEINFETRRLKDKEIDGIFKSAYIDVQHKAGSADFALRLAGLDCSDCARMLMKATGKDCWSLQPWSVDEVIETAKAAQWEFEFERKQAWAYWSARNFLNACAAARLSIRFSF